MKILFFGDVFGRPGREALLRIIPEWRASFSPAIIIANGENMSHGAGISESSVKEILQAGVDIITGGNHSIEGPDAGRLLDDTTLPLLRPANMAGGLPGRGFDYFSFSSGTVTRAARDADSELLVINLISQTNMRFHYDSPFSAFEKILKDAEVKKPKIILVDWHADASSEKIALGWLADGHVTAVLGTHTHTPTADERILPKGTAFISDVGMVGPHYSVIGQEIEENITRLILQTPKRVDVAPAPPYEINAVLIDINETTWKATRIERLRKIIY
ncbi:MAG: YmdB family metallophosphoesterase [Candidatus Sungbacteria bacterium]|nr:YmdB family metallophosphoesterase [Candidatus Sungbacteria bacterium]